MSSNNDLLYASVLQHLKDTQVVIQKKQREDAIAAEASRFRQAGTKRSVKFARTLINEVEDIEELLKVGEGEEFATVDNLEDVNATVRRLKELLADHKRSIQHELNMQIVAATSPLKWKTVAQMEGGLSLLSCVTVDGSEVRKAEKESMAYERDLRNASRAVKRGAAEEEWSGASKRGRGGSFRYRGRGGAVGAVGGKERVCFRCGEKGHFIAQCGKDKPKSG